MTFNMSLSKNAISFLESISSNDKQRIIEKLKQLEQNPYSLPYKKIKGRQRTYRIRIGDFRIIYAVHESEIRILKVGRREGIYN
ncbi:MAG: type II toxin-antitoxin system RelE/ParE family toxin [Methanosarcinales archaeon]|nr:type II toxin-antitoxin system RelE/ParE family toxin [Methanosarcinales archaeon]